MVRTVVSATDLRVRLGEMLRRLEHEDLVIEKGGVPVAVLTRYMPEPASRSPVAGGKHDEYEAALVKRADARGWETTLDAIRSGWGSEVDADAMARRVYEARDMNRRRSRNYTVDLENESAPGSEDGDHAWTTAPARLRRLHRPPEDPKRVADAGTAPYDAGTAGDHSDHLR